jgi:uncharacterized protein
MVPGEHNAQIARASFSWNYTTWLNLIILCIDGILLWRFLTTRGLHMLKMMYWPMPRR